MTYFDDRSDERTYDEIDNPSDCPQFQAGVEAFKTAKGLDKNYHPEALYLHNNFKITTNDVPSSFFYTEDELSGSYVDLAKGSMKDRTYLYVNYTGGDMKLSGNFFQYRQT